MLFLLCPFSLLVLLAKGISHRLLYLALISTGQNEEQATLRNPTCLFIASNSIQLERDRFVFFHPSLSFGAINLNQCPVGQVLLNLGRTDRLRMEEQLEVEMVVYNYLRVKVRHSSYAPLSSKVSIRAVRCIWEKGEALRVSTGGGGLRE